MPPALAYFITWTTYGTWLHGDPRGSADRSGVHGPGRPYLDPDPRRVSFERSELAREAVLLSDPMRRVVDETVRRHIETRGWALRGLNVRTNHVHVVVSVGEIAPERVMGQLKAWSSRRLREQGLIGTGQRVWTRHGSTRWLNHQDAVSAAVNYVLNRQ